MTQLAQTVDPAPLLPAQMGDYRAIPIAAIRIGLRLRYVRPDAVSNLANNIAEHGLHVALCRGGSCRRRYDEIPTH